MTLLQEQAEVVLRGRNAVLKKLISGAALADTLESLTEVVEDVLPELICSILLLDTEKKLLRTGAAPSLPDFYNLLIDGVAIGPDAGSCGAAAFRGERVIAEDVLAHPNWEPWRDVTRQAGFRSCWSEPIFSTQGKVLGTFALYHRAPRRPDSFELEFIRSLADVAGIAIETKNLERERHQLQLQLRQIIDLDPHMIFAKDWSGRFLLANKAMAQAYGTTVEELTGRSHSEFHGDRDELEHMLADDREVMRSGRPKTIPEETFVDVQGRRHVLQTVKIPYQVSGVGERAVLGVAVDITDLKRVQASLEHKEELFRQLAESIREVFWLTDWKANRVLYVSPAYATIWGRSERTLYEDPGSWAQVVHPEDRERVISRFRECASEGTYSEEYRIVREDGSQRWIHDRAFPIRDEQGEVYRIAGISEDVTERKGVELDLQSARDELAARAREQLRSMASELLLAEERERKRLAEDLHDGLNQLITLVRMKLSGLRKGVNGQVCERIDEIAGLVDDANQAARSLTFQLSPPILHDLGFQPAIQWLVEDVQRSFGLTIDLDDPEEDELGELGERVRVLLFRAVRELLINVAKHANANRTGVRLLREGETLHIWIEDDGDAFDADAVGVRGMGLNTIRERLTHLGGRMEIDSRADRGTRVHLVAPLGVEEARGG